MRLGQATIVAVLAVAVMPLCKHSSDRSGERDAHPSDWASKSWRFSRTRGLPSTGWIEFEPEHRTGAIRVVDLSCSTEPRCRFEGTFKASRDEIELHVHPWEDKSFKVRATDSVMEWTRDGVVIERFTHEPMPKVAPPERDLDDPIKCRSDTDCPTVLACGPCGPNQPVLNRHVRVNCTVNPCPGRQSYCTADRICAVKP